MAKISVRGPFHQKMNSYIAFDIFLFSNKLRPEQFNFLFFEHLGQKRKIGGGKKNKNKSKHDTLIRDVHILQHLIHYKHHY